MRKISSVHLDIARFSYEISTRSNDADLATWVRNFVRCLVMRDPSIDSYGAELLEEVSEYRKKDAGRKGKRFPTESDGIRGIPCNSVNKEQSRLEQSNQKKEIPKKEKFVAPTVADVSAYCQERKNGISPEQFVDFYTSKNWMIGKNPMKDWKAAVRTWERSRTEQSTQSADGRTPITLGGKQCWKLPNGDRVNERGQKVDDYGEPM